MKAMRSAVLAVIGCLATCPLLCLSNADGVCEDMLSYPTVPNSFLAYITNTTVDVGTGNEVCSGVTLNCNASVNVQTTQGLSGHTWFVEPLRNYVGARYPQQLVQRFNIQCPTDHLTHLVMQDLGAPNTDATTCGPDSGEFVRVSDGVFNYTMCNNQTDPNFQNDGLGVITTNPVTVEFCSNDDITMGIGFVLRVTCLDPKLWRCRECRDYFFYKTWDAEFVDRINDPFPNPATGVVQHKRSTRSLSDEEKIPREIARMLKGEPAVRKKRFGVRFEVFELSEDDNVIYSGNTVTILRGELMDVDPLEVFDDIVCLTTYNELVQTRVFYVNATSDLVDFVPMSFSGPGKLHIYGSSAFLFWTIEDPSTFFLPGLEIMAAANTIYDYIYRNFQIPYPLIDNIPTAAYVFPPADADRPSLPAQYKRFDTSGVVFPEVEERSTCRRIIQLNRAPQSTFRIPDSQFRFCRFFQQACDITLRTACKHLLALEGVQPVG